MTRRRFQSFESNADFSSSADRVARLRAELAAGGYAGVLVPLADEHQGEYLPPSAGRLKWLTGFAGSAGLAVVLSNEAAIFVDGRYTLQVREQVDLKVFSPRHLIDEPPAEWLASVVSTGARIAYDPWLHTLSEVRRLKVALEAVGAELVAVERNLVDLIWHDRPAPPQAPVTIFPEELAGTGAGDKIAGLAARLLAQKLAGAVLTQPDSIMWLFNIRGGDVPHTPLALSFAILRADGRPQLFIDPMKLAGDAAAYLSALAELHAPAGFEGALGALGAGGARVLIDPMLAADRIATVLVGAGANLVEGDDPVLLPKARKTAAEQTASRAAHVRDAVAMVRFLAWFDREAPKGGLSEVSAAEALEDFRAATGQLRDLSFDSISAAGPHAAIPHYRVSHASDLPIREGEFYLIDSGAQYLDGTTDITRTIAVGAVTAEMKDRFTRVLKGHIGIARARFPAGTTGAHLDILARQPLWQAGLDFDHGTGHGVGLYLSVHEGPQRISRASRVALEPGMLISNEPGYYKAGFFGIRLENLVFVTAPERIAGGERAMMGLETISFAPFDRRAIDKDLLTADEIAWLDAYHAKCRDTVLAELVDETERDWLRTASEPL